MGYWPVLCLRCTVGQFCPAGVQGLVGTVHSNPWLSPLNQGTTEPSDPTDSLLSQWSLGSVLNCTPVGWVWQRYLQMMQLQTEVITQATTDAVSLSPSHHLTTPYTRLTMRLCIYTFTRSLTCNADAPPRRNCRPASAESIPPVARIGKSGSARAIAVTARRAMGRMALPVVVVMCKV